MESVPGGRSIVIAGGWNVRIFSPLWITQHLTGDQEVRLEISVNNPTLPMRLLFEGLELEVSGARLAIKPASLDLDAFRRAQRVARDILDLLPHTPVTAVGINFKYIERRPEPELARLFQLLDNPGLARAHARIQTTTLRRSLLFQERLLNLSLAYQDDDTVEFDFNFHHPSEGAIAARAHLNADVEDYHNMSLQLLDEAYNLELAEAV